MQTPQDRSVGPTAEDAVTESNTTELKLRPGIGRVIRMHRGTKLGLAAVAVVAVAGAAVWRASSGGATSAPLVEPITVARGNVVVSVSGIGKIVEARSSAFGGASRSATSGAGNSAGASSGSGSGGGGPAPAGAIFPGASGSLTKYFVKVGQTVPIGQPLAVIDDRGAAAAAAKQARNDLATARVELQQKRTNDPAKGTPPTRAELNAAQLAVAAAKARLTQLLRPPRPADVSAARADVARAEADLEAALGGTPASIARERNIALRNVQLAQERLDRVLAPAGAAEISAARAELAKAEADLDALRTPAPPPAAALAAARQAVARAQATLSAAQASGVAADISAAQLELARAEAELAALTQPPPPPSPAGLNAAERAVDAAREKLAKLLQPPSPADVTAARIELERARSDLAVLEAGPKPAALAAARRAVTAAWRKLAQVTGPALPADVKLAKADVGRAQADLSVLRGRGGPASAGDLTLAGLRMQSAAVRLSTALATQELLTVRSSSDGRITALLAQPGSPVDPLTPIASVQNLAELAVSVDMSEFDVASVKPGLRAVVTVDALGGDSFPGGVTFAAPTGSDTGGVVTFPVRVALEEAAGLKPGMTASVRIIVAQRNKVIQVPVDAVTQDAKERSIVTVVDASGRESEREVTLGLANNKSVEILKGLEAGERILPPPPEPPAAGEAP